MISTDVPRPFRDRAEAGRTLAARLEHYAGRPDVIVLALPRGGVPVAAEVAAVLRVPLELFLVRKLGAPGQPELAMGAVASGGPLVLNEHVVSLLHVSSDVIARIADVERAELERQEQAYRGSRPMRSLADRVVVLIDDGLATGATMRAAVRAVRQQRPRRVVVAVPTAAPASVHELRREADEVVSVMAPDDFQAVGHWYEEFSQTSDAEVQELLARAARRMADGVP